MQALYQSKPKQVGVSLNYLILATYGDSIVHLFSFLTLNWVGKKVVDINLIVHEMVVQPLGDDRGT